jgi:putative pyruvate formate lyase activating enzyme
MICNICPRRCGAERTETYGGGFCRMPAVPVIARAGLHLWEEPVLSGTRGSGAVFFSGCSLGCVYCQNHTISAEGVGKAVTTERLREIFHELIGQEAACLDLVTPTHFTGAVLEALGDGPWPVPVVWNCGGYERVETLKTLEGRVQIYLPDLKYALEKPARELSCAGDYFPVAAAAIDEMLRQVGPYRIGDDGLMKSGVIIRHLVLPGQLENTKAVIDYVSAHFPPHTVLFSLMSQYTPQPGAEGKLARKVTKAEYRAAERYMADCGIADGFTQERTSAKEEYTPDFHLQGI